MTPFDKIKVIKEDEDYVMKNREKIIDRYTKIVVNSREK